MAINVVDIDVSKVEQISKIKNEPKWMTDFRVNAYKKSNADYIIAIGGGSSIDTAIKKWMIKFIMIGMICLLI